MTVLDWPQPAWTWLAFLLELPLWTWLVVVLGVLLLGSVSQNFRLNRRVASLSKIDDFGAPILVGPPTPDMKLNDVVVQIRDYLISQGESDGDITGKRLNTELADGLSIHDPSVWGRYQGEGALTALDQWNFSSASLNIAKNSIRVANDWSGVTYTDLRFNRSEINEIWPLPA